jgi:hypothetical protein
MENEQTNPQSETQQESGEKKKKLSKAKIILIIIALVIIWFIAVQLIAAEKYDMVVNIKEEENIMGINPLADKLDFGDLSRNLGSSRIVTLKNDSGSDRYILIWMRGEISDMVELNKNNFTLKSGEEVKLEFRVQVPPSAEVKIYEGKASIFKWPKLF